MEGRQSYRNPPSIKVKNLDGPDEQVRLNGLASAETPHKLLNRYAARFNSVPRFTLKSVSGTKIGLCIDTETTGLNHAENKIIELGIVAFEYSPVTAEIIMISDRYNGFEDPGSS